MKVVAAIGLLLCPITPSSSAETAKAGPPTRYALSGVTITLDQPGCGVICPSYVVSIHGDGRVVYEGRQNVGTIGLREEKIETERMLELLNHIYRIRFFSMSDEYTYGQSVSIVGGEAEVVSYRALDATATTISATINGYQKRVKWIPLFSPPELIDLQSRIEQISQVHRWLN